MRNFLGYIKKNGLLHAVKVLYRYKLQIFFCKILNFIYKRKPILNIIVIESHNDFDGNGGAFYKYLIDNEFNKKYKIIWLIKNKKPKYLPVNVDAFYLFKPSIKKAYYLCRTKIFTADDFITNKLREDQISVYFGHGAFPLKNVSGHMVVPESTDYVLTPSQKFNAHFAQQVSLPYPSDKFINLGFPFNDILFSGEKSDVGKLTTKNYSKIIVWMPTFRKGGGENRNDSDRDLPYGVPLLEHEDDFIRLQNYLFDNNILLIIKIHPMQDLSTIEKLKESDNIKILTGESVKRLNIDNYRLIKGADALISDYSSIVYSYILLDRPIGFVLSDLKDYKIGLSINNPDDFLVGNKIYNIAEFLSFISAVNNEVDEYADKRRKLLNQMYDYTDGNSCLRIAEFFNL